MRNSGGSSQPVDIERHCEVWESKVLRTGSLRGSAKLKTLETALGLNQAVSQASQPRPAAAAAGPPTADGGGGGTDAQVIVLARKNFAMEAQIEKLERRSGILEKSIKTINSKFASVMNSLKPCASPLPNYKLARPS